MPQIVDAPLEPLGKTMRRRDFIKGMAGSAGTWPLAARAQQPIPAIGYLGANTLDNNYTMPQISAFRQGLKESGLVEERDLTILFQWADGRYDRLPALATELVSRNVSVIFASTLPSALAAKQVTSSIPAMKKTLMRHSLSSPDAAPTRYLWLMTRSLDFTARRSWRWQLGTPSRRATTRGSLHWLAVS